MFCLSYQLSSTALQHPIMLVDTWAVFYRLCFTALEHLGIVLNIHCMVAFYNVRFALFLDFYERRLKINNFKAFPNMQSWEKIKNVQYLLMHSTYNAWVSIKKKICFTFRFLCTVLTKKNVTGILTNFLWWSNIIYLIYPKNRFQKVFRFSCPSWYLLSSEMFVSIDRVVNSCACLVVCTVLLL